MTGESTSERESKRFEKGLNAKVKLSLYVTFGKDIEVKEYLNGVADGGSRFLVTNSSLMRNWVGIVVRKVKKM